MADRPNILLIFSDQHRGDAIGAVGHPAVLTPNLDSLAAEAATFERCVTNSPLCMPARASLISGQYVNKHGVWNNGVVADRHGPSHVRNVRDAGYHTAVIGKTHLYVHGGASDTEEHVQELLDWGYEYVHELTGPVASTTMDSPYTRHLASKRLLDVHRESLRSYLRGARGRYSHPWEEPPTLLPTEDHLDSYTASRAVDWIRDYRGDRPFYLQACFPGPHNPFDSPAEYRAMYDADRLAPAIMETPSPPVAPLVQRMLVTGGLGSMGESQSRVMQSYYHGKVTLIDEGVGRVLRALQERGYLDNTWVIYTSDHGEMLGDHRLNHKTVFYDGSLRIPCIIRPPGGTTGWKSAALTDQIDVTATILDIAGAVPLSESDGRSLASQVEAGPEAQGAQTGKDAVFSEVYGFSMVRTDRYKMSVDARTRQPVDLYDMVDDPQELHNLVNDRALESVRRELLDDHLGQLFRALDVDKLAAVLSLGERPGGTYGVTTG